MDSLSDEILVKIFKNLDLKTRVDAAKTCERWCRLIFDPEVAIDDDISEVQLDISRSYKDSPSDAKADARSVLAHLDRRVRLNFASQFVGNDILADPEMGACFGRFENFVLLDNNCRDNGPISSYWSQLPTSMKHASVDESGLTRFSLDVFSGEWTKLESLDLKLYELHYIHNDDDVKHNRLSPTRIVLPSGLKSFCITCSCSIRYLLQYVQLTPSLVELDLKGMEFVDTQLLQLLRLIRDALPNLERLRFRECELISLPGDEIENEERYFRALQGFRNEQFLVPTLKRIELYRLTGDTLHFKFAVAALLDFSTVECISITTNQFVEEIYDLTPLIVDKAAILQLSIVSDYMSLTNGKIPTIDEIPSPTELACIVRKFELVKVQCLKVFRPMFIDASFDLLTDMRLEVCHKLGDAELAIVAGWCKSLENLYFEPDNWDMSTVLTDQCLVPFLSFWDDRRSKHLVIECLKPAAPFGGFSLPANGDTGGFTDDKRWARYRKTFPTDGSCHVYGK